VRNFVDLTSWTVARKLQLAQCWRAAQIASSFPGTKQWGFYHLEAALEFPLLEPRLLGCRYLTTLDFGTQDNHRDSYGLDDRFTAAATAPCSYTLPSHFHRESSLRFALWRRQSSKRSLSLSVCTRCVQFCSLNEPHQFRIKPRYRDSSDRLKQRFPTGVVVYRESNSPAPMNHVKYLRAGPAEIPIRNWYTTNTNYFKLTDSVRWKWKTQPDWVIKPITHDIVRRIRFWRINISRTWF